MSPPENHRKPAAIDDAEARRIAVEDLDRNLFIEAGAGTGKTTLLVQRIINLLRTGRARLPQIAAITFTEKAAGELLHRIRGALERCLASGLESAEARSALEEALLDIEHAPITTIHGLAGQILRERPVEAGVDPRFTPLDEVTAGFLIEELWDGWLPGALERDPLPARRALALGIRLDEIFRLAVFLLENRDRTAGEIVEAREPADASAFLGSWSRIDEDLRAQAPLCREPADDALIQIARLGGDLQEARRLLAAGDGLRTGRRIAFLVIHANKGNQKNWKDKDGCRRAKALFKELKALQEDFAGALHQEAIRGLAAWLQGFVVSALGKLRARGVLRFQDYLVECRDLLRRNLEVRGYFQKRFRRILVDEFQDTDPLQAEIAFFLAEADPRAAQWRQVQLAPGKLCIVGDPKQSIYRFRRADIELYEEVRGRVGNVIAIRKNFRTVTGVIDWVNRTFSVLIRPPDDGRYQPEYIALEPHRGAPEGPAVQDLPAPGESARAEDARRLEAEALAELLQEIAGRGGNPAWTIEDPAAKTRRPARCGDIGVLFRSSTGIHFHEEALRARGIPFHMEGGKEFFRCQEVAGILNCLAALERPQDGTALVAALKSAVFGHSDPEVLELVASGGRLSLLAEPPRDLASRPIAESLRFLRNLHAEAHRLPLARLVGRLVEDTGALCAATLRRRGGISASQNLCKLVAMARSFDARGGDEAAFGQFGRWLRKMSREEAKEAESAAFEERDDVVRFLSIHKAKGLEFPVTILVNLGGQEQFRDRFLWSGDHLEIRFGGSKDGIATAGFEAAKDRERLRRSAENIRLLYVACTRARDRLVISRIVPGARGESGLAAILAVHQADASITPGPHREAEEAEEEAGGDLGTGDLLRLREEVIRRPERILREYRPPCSVRPSGERREEGGSRSGSAEADHPGASTEDRAAVREARAFGIAVHRAMETVDLRTGEEDRSGGGALRSVCTQAAREAGIAHRGGEVLEAVSRALRSAVISRARRSPWIRREVPFLVDLGGDGSTVSGAVDLVFEEDGGLVIVDFKTDRVKAPEAPLRAAAYRPQLLLYARALGRIAGKEVRSAVLVFTSPGVEQSFDLRDQET